MKYAVVLLAALASAQAGSLNRAGWSPTTPGWTTLPPTTAGWNTEPPTTQGWSTEAPTTQGWSTEPPPTVGWSHPPTTSGWPSAPAPGWAPSNVAINLAGEAAAAASGWAAENHAEAVDAVGGWGVPAGISIVSAGESVLDQSGALTQVTNIDNESASSINLAGISHYADAAENVALNAAGLAVNYDQSGWAAASGQGALASDAHTLLLANQGH